MEPDATQFLEEERESENDERHVIGEPLSTSGFSMFPFVSSISFTPFLANLEEHPLIGKPDARVCQKLGCMGPSKRHTYRSSDPNKSQSSAPGCRLMNWDDLEK